MYSAKEVDPYHLLVQQPYQSPAVSRREARVPALDGGIDTISLVKAGVVNGRFDVVVQSGPDRAADGVDL